MVLEKTKELLELLFENNNFNIDDNSFDSS